MNEQVPSKKLDLLPCPWCGGSNLNKYLFRDGDLGLVEYVQCMDCVSCGPDQKNGLHWNKRHAPEPCPGEHEDPDFKREDGSCAICSPQPPIPGPGMHPNCTDPCPICDRMDAERYRFLRDQRRWYVNTPPAPGINIKFEYLIADNGAALDAAIDRATSTKGNSL